MLSAHGREAQSVGEGVVIVVAHPSLDDGHQPIVLQHAPIEWHRLPQLCSRQMDCGQTVFAHKVLSLERVRYGQALVVVAQIGGGPREKARRTQTRIRVDNCERGYDQCL